MGVKNIQNVPGVKYILRFMINFWMISEVFMFLISCVVHFLTPISLINLTVFCALILQLFSFYLFFGQSLGETLNDWIGSYQLCLIELSSRAQFLKMTYLFCLSIISLIRKRGETFCFFFSKGRFRLCYCNLCNFNASQAYYF